MTHEEIISALNRAAAEAEGWAQIEYGQGIKAFTGFAPSSSYPDVLPNYCHPDVPHSRLWPLLEKLETLHECTVFSHNMRELTQCGDPKRYNQSKTLAVCEAPPLYQVFACLAALDKLPEGLTLEMIRDAGKEGKL